MKHETGKPDDHSEPLETAVPIIGIGASAGGLAAFESFFSQFPPEPGVAFVLVQHLSPDHQSNLVGILQRQTGLHVLEVENQMRVRPNFLYIIPPSQDLALFHGRLQLVEPESPRGQRLPIDFFFRSLAAEQGERSIAVILSGNGSDGTLGARSIKQAGGLVLAQTPESTDHPGMPGNAIQSGVVDHQMLPAEMAQVLIDYISKLKNVELMDVASRVELFALLRRHTGGDFSHYKPTTFERRVQRRMAVHQSENLQSYVELAKEKPEEVQALFQDLLIGVTSFFRDPEAFQVLEKSAIGSIISDKKEGETIRVWVPACSTGEEAYSIAMLMVENQQTHQNNLKLQIFATDIDGTAVARARSGRYTATVAEELSPERLQRFFVSEPGLDGQAGFYRVKKVIRDLLIFSEQDVLSDPPFSKLDLVSCRNLLIYFNSDLQKKIIPLFHYALAPDGFLFLGTSESVGQYDQLFVEDPARCRLYQKKSHDSKGRNFLPFSSYTGQPLSQARILPSLSAAASVKQSLRHLTETELLKDIGLSAALVNETGDILYIHGRTGSYLELAEGNSGVNNILTMAREGLKRHLTTGLYHASQGRTVRHPNVEVKSGEVLVKVNLTVRPVEPQTLKDQSGPLCLVVLERVPGEAGSSGEPCLDLPPDAQRDERLAELIYELQAKEDFLQVTTEELRTSNEELRSSNEEMQSINEELQSTNEELETSKEELQSVNEELSTVNAELEHKIQELSRINNDMANLLAGTGIGTIFLDTQLRVMRFTPTAKKIVNLIPGDVGRPVAHLSANFLNYESLVSDAKSVLDTLNSLERTVQTQDGEWHIIRLMPYRTLDNVVEGAVLTFLNVDAIKRGELVAQREAERMRTGIQPLPLVLFHQDAQLKYTWIFGDQTDGLNQEAVGKSDQELFSQEEAATLTALKSRTLESGLSQYQDITLKLSDEGRRFQIRVGPWPAEEGQRSGLLGSLLEVPESPELLRE